MKKIIILFFVNSIFGFAQTNELCDLVFSKKENFSIIEVFNGKIPRRFIILDKTETWNPEMFYLENLNLNDQTVLAEIDREEHHPYHSVYLFSNNLLNEKIEETEKIRLFQLAKSIKSSNIQLQGKNYKTEEKFKQNKGFYFLITEPIYSEKEKFAFLEITIKNKGVLFGESFDDYYGILIVMFEKDVNGQWYQIGIKKHLIL